MSAVLESVIADPASFMATEDKRLALYQSLCSLWSSLSVNHKADVTGNVWDATIQERLSNLPGKARQVYLLRAVEGFDFPQIAEIQRTDVEDVKGLHDQASQQISSMLASDVLIIEDEPLIALLEPFGGNDPTGTDRRTDGDREPEVLHEPIDPAHRWLRYPPAPDEAHL